jgi:hypothetical protein
MKHGLYNMREVAFFTVGSEGRKCFDFRYNRECRWFASLEYVFIPLQPNKLAKNGWEHNVNGLLFIPIFKEST